MTEDVSRSGATPPTTVEPPTMASATRREDPNGSEGFTTRREEGVPTPGTVPPTSLEGTEAGVPAWVPIPPQLQVDYKYLQTLHVGGGEGTLHVAERKADGERVLLKIYNPGIPLDEDALVAIQERVPLEHVVQLHDWGQVESSGAWYEVQEYLPGGDLNAFVSTVGELHNGRHRLPSGSLLLRLIISELMAAVRAFHDAGLSHHDLKPANVLVRKCTPAPGYGEGTTLDLVLADFGLSIAADRTVFLSRRQGTSAYDSPESLGAGQGGPKRDYWALGITIAELVGGRHPFADQDGSILPDSAIRDHLYRHRPIDLSSIDDERVRRLCAGLTRYEEVNRWGALELERWLTGDDPDVIADGDPSEASETHGIHFAGASHATPAALARAMAHDWDAATAAIGTSARRQSFVDEISSTFGSQCTTHAKTSWAFAAPKPDRGVVDLLASLDARLPPVVLTWTAKAPDGTSEIRGHDLSRTNLAALVRSALTNGESGPGNVQSALEKVWDQQLLVGAAKFDGHQELADIDAEWRRAVAAIEAHQVTATDAQIEVPFDLPTVRSTLLAATVDGTFRDELVRQRDAAIKANPAAQPSSWFAKLANDRTDPAAILAARLLASAVAEHNKRIEIERREAERQRLDGSIAPVRRWLTLAGVLNLMVGVGLLAANLKQESLALKAGDGGWVEPHDVLQSIARYWWVWSIVGVGALVGRRQVHRDPAVSVIHAAQGMAVLATCSLPPLIPFGIRRAFVARRIRTGAARSMKRLLALGSAVVAAVAGVGLVSEHEAHQFRRIQSEWPRSASQFYFDNWPENLDPPVMTMQLTPWLVGFSVVFLLGFISAWLSYEHEAKPAVRSMQMLAILGGGAVLLTSLPLIATGVAYLLVGAFFLAAGVLAAVFAGYVLMSMLEDGC